MEIHILHWNRTFCVIITKYLNEFVFQFWRSMQSIELRLFYSLNLISFFTCLFPKKKRNNIIVFILCNIKKLCMIWRKWKWFEIHRFRKPFQVFEKFDSKKRKANKILYINISSFFEISNIFLALFVARNRDEKNGSDSVPVCILRISTVRIADVDTIPSHFNCNTCAIVQLCNVLYFLIKL